MAKKFTNFKREFGSFIGFWKITSMCWKDLSLSTKLSIMPLKTRKIFPKNYPIRPWAGLSKTDLATKCILFREGLGELSNAPTLICGEFKKAQMMQNIVAC